MAMVIDILSGLFLLIGSFLCLSGGIGLLRFPDFYTRMHAAGVTDTLATTMIIIGLILQNPDAMVIMKLIIILLLTLLIGPTASHALAKAAFKSQHKPLITTNKSKESQSSKH
ncbi:MAG: monovalent cation/H(+) antiporter subunit G [Marinicellaceae bacterium]